MPSSVDATELKTGLKLLIDGQPYVVIERQFVKPGKGAAFTRTKMKNLLTGRNIESNIRSGEKIEEADIEEKAMSFLYKEGEDFVFMDQQSYEQINLLKDGGRRVALAQGQHDLPRAVLEQSRDRRHAAELRRAQG